MQEASRRRGLSLSGCCRACGARPTVHPSVLLAPDCPHPHRAACLHCRTITGAPRKPPSLERAQAARAALQPHAPPGAAPAHPPGVPAAAAAGARMDALLSGDPSAAAPAFEALAAMLMSAQNEQRSQVGRCSRRWAGGPPPCTSARAAAAASPAVSVAGCAAVCVRWQGASLRLLSGGGTAAGRRGGSAASQRRAAGRALPMQGALASPTAMRLLPALPACLTVAVRPSLRCAGGGGVCGAEEAPGCVRAEPGPRAAHLTLARGPQPVGRAAAQGAERSPGARGTLLLLPLPLLLPGCRRRARRARACILT